MATDTLSPAEQAIAEARSARDSFLSEANELFETQRSDGINNLGKALEAAAPEPPKAAPAPAAPAAPPPAAKPTSTIPGPPQAVAPPAKTPASEPAGPASQQATTEPADVPPADAFDKGPSRPTTNNWRKLHAAFDATKATLTSQLEAARKEVETLKATTAGAGRQDGVLPPELQKQLETLQQERDTLVKRLEAVAVEKSPRFEALFKPRKDAAIQQAKLAVGPDKAERIAALLEQPESAFRDEQLEAVINEIGGSPLRSQKLLGAVAELDRINSERQAVAQQGSQVFKQWQAEEQAAQRRQQEERQRSVQTTFDAVVNEWQQAGAGLDENGLAIARDVFMGNKELKEIAQASMWVAYGPRAAATAMKLQADLDAANAELARYRSAQPKNASDAGTALKPDDELPSNLSYADAIVQAGLKAGLLR